MENQISKYRKQKSTSDERIQTTEHKRLTFNIRSLQPATEIENTTGNIRHNADSGLNKKNLNRQRKTDKRRR